MYFLCFFKKTGKSRPIFLVDKVDEVDEVDEVDKVDKVDKVDD